MSATLSAAATAAPVYAGMAPEDQGRRRARTIGREAIERMAEDVRATALATGAWAHDADHGGSVPNCYGYPAITTGALVVSDPAGRVVVWMCSRPANKVTLSGVVGSCVPGAHPLYDHRYGRAADLRAEEVLRAAHAEVLAAE